MTKILAFILLLVCQSFLVLAQYDKKLKQDIINTGYIHRPLPLDYSKAFETFGLTKKVLSSTMFLDMENDSKWSHKGIGGMYITPGRSKSGKHSLRLVAPTTYPQFLEWEFGFGP